MRTYFFSFLVVATLLCGCATTYQSRQMPDDVYHSPGNNNEIYTARNGNNAYTERNNNYNQYEDYVADSDDRYLRMKVQDRYRWNAIDDYAYWNDSRYYTGRYSYNPFLPNIYTSFSFGNTWGWPHYSLYSPYPGSYYSGGNYGHGYGGQYWNSWDNPCYGVVYYKNPVVYKSTNSPTRISAYDNNRYSNSRTNRSQTISTRSSTTAPTKLDIVSGGRTSPATGYNVPPQRNVSSSGNGSSSRASSSTQRSSSSTPSSSPSYQSSERPSRPASASPSSNPAPSRSSGSSGGTRMR